MACLRVMKNDIVSRRELLFGRRADKAGAQPSLFHDEAGTSAVEYGLIVGLLALALTGALTQVARRQRQNYRCVRRAMRGREPNRFCANKGA
ncbi:MAG: hypothetical protein AAGA24_02795 [Pseudomonadota bacterium]